MKLLTVDTIDQARAKILKLAKSWPLNAKPISCNEAQNRILAKDVYASCDIPGFDRAIVDGYAVHAADTAGVGEAIPVFLKQAGRVVMGKQADLSIARGECA